MKEFNVTNDELVNNLNVIMSFIAIFLGTFTEIYTLGRMFRKFSDNTYPKNIIVYMGDLHIKNYIEFIKNNLEPEIIFEKSEEYLENNYPNKCINIPKDNDDILDFKI